MTYDLKWRIWAKTVAVIDLIFICLQLLFVLLGIFAVGVVVASSDYDNRNETHGATWVIWVVVILVLLITGIGLWAAIRLFQATKLGQQSDLAYQYSRFWLIVNIVAIILTLIQSSTEGAFITMAIRILIRFLFMYVVYCFMREVQAINNAPPQQTTRKV